MATWRELAAEGRWAEIDPFQIPQREQAELLAMLRQAVPMINVTNGAEMLQRHIYPMEVVGNPQLRAAAEILYLGELEAMVEGEPESASLAWKKLAQQAHEYLNKAEYEGEVTDGSQELSRLTHIAAARDALAQVDRAIRLLAGEGTTEEESAWISEALTEVAQAAFLAGRRVQSAWGKPIERGAARHELDQRRRSDGGKSRIDPDHEAIIAAMASRIELGQSVRQAATATHVNDSLGVSAVANIRRWERHQQKRPK